MDDNTSRLEVLLNKNLKDRLERMAETTGRTVTSIVRMAIASEVGIYETSVGCLSEPVSENNGDS
jgi:predicted DNA-binding protein